MLTVTDLQGNSEPIVDLQGTAIRQRVNENYELSFNAIKTKSNITAYEMLHDESMITCNDENFIIKTVQELPYSKNILALHEFFEIIDDYVESKLTDGNYTIQQALAHVFSQTIGWSWVVDDVFENKFLSDFGDENPIALLNTILETYGAEYVVTSVNKTITIKKKIGVQTDEQVRFKHNLSSINRDIDASNVKTAMKVYFNPDGYGGYQSNVVYQSPRAGNYRKLKWAAPLYLDHVYNQAEALRIAETQLEDVPVISIATTFVELKNSGYNADNIALGNSFYLIDERMNLNESVRIIEIETYPLDKGKSPTLVCANARKIIENINVSQQQQQNNLDREAVKQSVVYNGASITETEGILINGKNGVRIRLNADLGFLIEKNGTPEFYVDTSGNLTFDGRLNISENGQTLLEAYMDTYGGRLLLNDADGKLNIKMGSESGLGANRGGTLVIYDDGSSLAHRRVELGISTAEGAGKINVRDVNGKARAFVYADSGIGAAIGITDANENLKSYIGETQGAINNEQIATRAWVLTQIPNINNLATRQWVEDNFEPKAP